MCGHQPAMGPWWAKFRGFRGSVGPWFESSFALFTLCIAVIFWYLNSKRAGSCALSKAGMPIGQIGCMPLVGKVTQQAMQVLHGGLYKAVQGTTWWSFPP